MSLSEEERRYLLRLARESITRRLRGESPPEIEFGSISPRLAEDGASFVTLTKWGDLRGCIGSLEPYRPLALDVRENAVAAAFRDPRFPPLSMRELDDVLIEVSVLSIPQPLPFDGPDDLLTKLRPGVDGVVIQRGWNRATFLPQVWEKLPDPRLFLEQLCLKARLPADAYRRPGLEVYTYQVEKFEEER